MVGGRSIVSRKMILTVVCCLLPVMAGAEVYPNGLLVSYMEVAVSPRAAGLVEEMFVREGQWVAAMDTLGVLESAKEKIDIQLGELELEELHVSLDKTKLPMRPKEIEKMELDIRKSALARDKAKSELERTTRLLEQKAVSDKDLADAKNGYDAAALSVKSLKVGLDLAKEGPRKEDILLQEMKIAQKMTTLELRRLALEKLTILSPNAGVISKLYYSPGEYAAAGQPFCDILYTDSLYVELNLPIAELKRVKEEMKAGVTVPSISAATYPGRVVYISPTVDPASRTFKIRIEIANPKRLLKPGLFATVSL